MTPKQLFDAGRVREAQDALAANLRNDPSDVPSRIFLFELLCFSGQYERAEKQLGLLAQSGRSAELGAIVYYAALHAEKSRNEVFRNEAFPKSIAASCGGTVNGRQFHEIIDADPNLGARLEVFAAGSYLWIPFEHILSIQVQPPRFLRDALWAHARVVTGPEFREIDLAEVLIPVIYPFTWGAPDQSLWLGRSTAWYEDENRKQFPLGQKLLLADGKEIPFLEVRSIEFTRARVLAQKA